MANCEILETCILFNDRLNNMPKTADIIKKKYCCGDNSECARHIIFLALGKEKVPLDLFPGQIERIHNILSENK